MLRVSSHASDDDFTMSLIRSFLLLMSSINVGILLPFCLVLIQLANKLFNDALESDSYVDWNAAHAAAGSPNVTCRIIGLVTSVCVCTKYTHNFALNASSVSSDVSTDVAAAVAVAVVSAGAPLFVLELDDVVGGFALPSSMSKAPMPNA